jgi:excisionase family DNA binding protein
MESRKLASHLEEIDKASKQRPLVVSAREASVSKESRRLNHAAEKTRAQFLETLTQHRLYDAKEVCALLHISLPSLRRAIKRGDIKPMYVGRLLRIPSQEVERLCNANSMLSVKEVADILHVGVFMIRMLIRSGELSALRLAKNGPWRIAQQELESYLSRSVK